MTTNSAKSVNYRGFALEAKKLPGLGFCCEVSKDGIHYTELDVTENCKLDFVAIELAKLKVDWYLFTQSN